MVTGKNDTIPLSTTSQDRINADILLSSFDSSKESNSCSTTPPVTTSSWTRIPLDDECKSRSPTTDEDGNYAYYFHIYFSDEYDAMYAYRFKDKSEKKSYT